MKAVNSASAAPCLTSHSKLVSTRHKLPRTLVCNIAKRKQRIASEPEDDSKGTDRGSELGEVDRQIGLGQVANVVDGVLQLLVAGQQACRPNGRNSGQIIVKARR